jgi:hypothetical protein
MVRVIVATLLVLGMHASGQGPAASQQRVPKQPIPVDVAFVVSTASDPIWAQQVSRYLEGAAAGSIGADVRFALIAMGPAGPIVASDLSSDAARFVQAARSLRPSPRADMSLEAVKAAMDRLSWSKDRTERHIVLLGVPGQGKVDSKARKLAEDKGYRILLIPYAEYSFPAPPVYTYVEEYATIGPLGAAVFTDYVSFYNLNAPRRHVVVPAQYNPQFNSNGTLSCIHRARALVIGSESQWKALWKEHAGTRPELAGSPPVDFDRLYVVAVFGGDMPTTGFYLKVREVRESEATIDVYVDLIKPKKDEVVYRHITQPWLIQPVPKIGGKRVQVHYKG